MIVGMEGVPAHPPIIAWCPSCPSNLMVERQGDRIEHVGPIDKWWPYGPHAFVPAERVKTRPDA